MMHRLADEHIATKILAVVAVVAVGLSVWLFVSRPGDVYDPLGELRAVRRAACEIGVRLFSNSESSKCRSKSVTAPPKPWRA